MHHRCALQTSLIERFLLLRSLNAPQAAEESSGPRALPETPCILRVGDHVIPESSTSVYEVTRISGDGRTADLFLCGTNLERFHVPVASLKVV
jgi:hypothetical protein